MRAHISNQHRGRVVSIIGGVNRLSRTIGPLVGGMVSDSFSSLVAPFYVQACLPVLALTLLHLTMADDKPDQTSAAARASAHGSLLHTMRTYKHIYITAGTSVFLLAFLRSSRSVHCCLMCCCTVHVADVLNSKMNWIAVAEQA
jgi:MFS family permease